MTKLSVRQGGVERHRQRPNPSENKHLVEKKDWCGCSGKGTAGALCGQLQEFMPNCTATKLRGCWNKIAPPGVRSQNRFGERA